jgi:hypothetical protein
MAAKKHDPTVKDEARPHRFGRHPIAWAWLAATLCGAIACEGLRAPEPSAALAETISHPFEAFRRPVREATHGSASESSTNGKSSGGKPIERVAEVKRTDTTVADRTAPPSTERVLPTPQAALIAERAPTGRAIERTAPAQIQPAIAERPAEPARPTAARTIVAKKEPAADPRPAPAKSGMDSVVEDQLRTAL